MNAHVMVSHALRSVGRQAQLVNNQYEATVPVHMRGSTFPYPDLNEIGVNSFSTILYVICGTLLTRPQSQMMRETTKCSSTHVHARIAETNIGIRSQQTSWVEAVLEFPPRDVPTNVPYKLLFTRIYDLSGYTIELRLHENGQIIDIEIHLEDRFGRYPFADKKSQSILHLSWKDVSAHLNATGLLKDTLKKPIEEEIDVRSYFLEL